MSFKSTIFFSSFIKENVLYLRSNIVLTNLRQHQSEASSSAVSGAKIELRVFDLAKITDFSVMPNCVSTFAMLFLFDIFKPTELQRLADKTLRMLTKIKDLYKPQISINETNSVAFGIENLFLNYFALCKHKPNAQYRLGFLNYVMSTSCLLEHLRRSGQQDYFVRFAWFKYLLF